MAARSTTVDNPWISLKNPLAAGSNIVKKDAFNFMFGARRTIHIYNTKENNWVREKIEHNMNNQDRYPCIGYNSKSKIMFIASSGSTTTFNMESKQINRYPSNHEPHSIFCVDNDEYHIIGGDGHDSNSNTHKVWNDETKQWNDEMDTFKEYSNIFGSFGYRLIYVPTKKEVLLFGGYDYNKHDLIDTIWKYCIPTKSWMRLNLKLPHKMNGFGCVLIKNEQYIIIMGGRQHNFHYEYDDRIFIFDLRTWKFSESKTKLPFRGVFCKAVVMENKQENDLCVHGFIREAMDKYNIKIPLALV